ncbi:uncharacterized protein LOC143298000 isoform X2 [Babylonia areolata]|uniref:uncharacterized protein LOC143298000 isoform X2 n=1 Tax=Babylonia areolata TaxID=304850 RepID=UPI003FD6A05C
MPLRISWSFNPGDNRSRSKMYCQGHYAKMRRPTGPELYEDASRILDELLEKQLNDQLRSHGRPPHFKTHPLATHRPITSGEVLDERDEMGLEEGGIERSKTMPSRMRGSKDEALLPKDLDALRKKVADKRSHYEEESPASSADTEGDSSLVSENRKKKGLLRRAKDRFLHSFHRQERVKEKLKDNDSPKMSPKKQAKKTQRKKASADQNGVKDNGGKYRGSGDGKDSVQNEGYGKRRNSAGKALLNTLRKSFKSKREDRRVPSVISQDDASIEKRPSIASSSGTGTGTSRPSPDQELPPPSCSSAATPPSRSSRAPSAPPPPAPSYGSSLTVPPTERKDSSVSPCPHSTSTDSHLGNGDVSSSVHSFSSVPYSRNVLDDPGDDIEFMDAVENGGDRTVVIPGEGGVRQGEERGSRRPYIQQSSLCVDGDSDTQDGNKGRIPGNTDDIPLHERTEEEKEQMYGKIAQKLIHMADTYAAESGVSDAEGFHRDAAAAAPKFCPEGDGVLSELEKQILECLRDAGDRNTQLVDSQAEEMIQQTKAQTYQRFKDTVQQSLGDNVSWNHLAFLFYTTKGVMSAVGIGSKIASDAKEMTLRYFSDKFAKWLMDQGGFRTKSFFRVSG